MSEGPTTRHLEKDEGDSHKRGLYLSDVDAAEASFPWVIPVLDTEMACEETVLVETMMNRALKGTSSSYRALAFCPSPIGEHTTPFV